MGGTPTRSQSHLLVEPHNRPIPSPTRHRAIAADKLFPVGSFVEVQTDEEDYKGVYFLATVIFSSDVETRNKKNSKKVLHVEYRNLLAQENGSDRLREYVDISWVRPAPPPEEIDPVFEGGDIVDAFFTDGWWTGVVSRVVKGGQRYVVSFQHPPDEREFGLKELRVHWDWVGGSWYRPVKKSASGSMFDVGKMVEVSFVDSDAWFPATIHEVLETGSFLVEYTVKKEGEAQTLKVAVDSFRIRPSPPLLKDRSFSLLERVESYFDFGWWSGVVTKVLEGGKYNVFFKLNKSEKEFSQSELRLPMEWKDEKWSTSSELSQKHPESAKGHKVEVAVNSSGDMMDTSDGNAPSSVELSSPVNQKSTRATKLQPKRKQTLPDSLSQPLKQHKEGNTVGLAQKDTLDGPIKQTLCTVNRAPVDNIITYGNQTATGDLSTDNTSSGKRTVRKQRTVGAILNEGEKVNFQHGIAKKSRTEMPSQDVTAEKEVDVVGVNEGRKVQNVHPSIETEPIVIGLPCTDLESPGDGISRSKRARFTKSKDIVKPASVVKHQLNGSANMKSKDGDLSGTGEVSVKRRRGRPAKVTLQNPESPAIDDSNIKELVKTLEPTEVGTEGAFVVHEIGVNEGKDKDVKQLETGSGKDKDVKQSETGSVKRKRGRPPVRVIVNRTDENGKKGEVGSVSEPHATHEIGTTAHQGSNGDTNKVAPPEPDSQNKEGSMPSEAIALLMLHPEKNRSNGDTDKVAPSEPDSQNKEGSTPLSKAVDKKLVEEPIVVKELIMLQRKRSAGRGRRQSIGEKFKAPAEDSLATTVQKTKEINSGMEVDKEVASEPASNEFDDQPLSRWISPSPSSSVVDGASKGKSIQSNMEQSKEKNAPTTNGTTSTSKDKALVTPKTFPFVKKSYVWKTIESMEVLQRMPQTPHFRPLLDFKENVREGLAIGHMVTFCTLVEKVSKLQYSDDKSISDEILETLGELETIGFDVCPVRERVIKLQALKDGQEKIIKEVSELNNQISVENDESSKFEKVISEIDEQIRKLQERRSIEELAKRKVDEKVVGLKVKLLKNEEIFKSGEREFDSVATSTL